MGASRRSGPSQRQLRVGEEIRHAISRVLSRGDLRDPALQEQSITVTEARASPDLRNVTVFVMPLGGGAMGDVEPVVAGLNRAARYLRGRVAAEVHLKFAPSLIFKADESFETAGRVDELLRSDTVAPDLAAEDTAAPRGDGGGDDA